MKSKFYDTIVAPATALINQTLGVIRISGEESFDIVNKSLKRKIEYISKPQLRVIYDGDKIVDEVILIPFVEKSSFTGEDVVEINCHGGKFVVEKILSILIKNGARIAEKGEFSKRAYLNGKLDLIKAESINELIFSSNEIQASFNAKNLINKNKKILKEIKDIIVDLISQSQTAIDYPEYEETENITAQSFKKSLVDIQKNISQIIFYSDNVNKLSNGINVVISGLPNVGKSSLLNSLINEQKAIVTDVEGTTRDIVEGKLHYENFVLNIFDTAGIRKSNNIVEKIGIEKSKEKIKEADLVLFVINKNKIDEKLFDEIKEQKHVVILNKIDEIDKKEIDLIKSNKIFKDEKIIPVSAKNNDLTALFKYLNKEFDYKIFWENETPLISNIETLSKFKAINENISLLINNIENGFSIDIINLDLLNIKTLLDELLGDSYDDEIIDNMFKKYCLGK